MLTPSQATAHRTAARGFSMVELVVAMGILVMVLALVAPGVSDWMSNLKVRAAAESLQGGLLRAKSEALKRNTAVSFWLVADTSKVPGATCQNSSTSAGWVVRVLNPVGACDTTVSMTTAPQIAARSAALENSSGLTVAALDANGNAANSATFTGLGQLALTVTNIASISVQSTAGNARPLRVVVDPGGMVRTCDPGAAATDPRSCNF